MINLSPSGLKLSNTELGMGRIIFIKLAPKILKLVKNVLNVNVRILKLRLFHSFIVLAKKELFECISPARILCNISCIPSVI